MIDCENEVYTRIVRMLREEFPGINVAGEYTKTPSVHVTGGKVNEVVGMSITIAPSTVIKEE